ncbi:MAG: hypothetical protein A2V64_13000 [Bacteroidetes bacterium RBG_13_43_22]|nr:MAG: hypothetical protein A2V64_13000 [Bacteroidetes bacterium RBG_13_43_22]
MYSLHKIAVSVLLLSLSSSASGGDPYRIPAGADGAGMGSVCILKNGFWSSFHNQALLAGSRSFSAGIGYENRFSISELGTRTAGLVFPAGETSLGIVYSHFGYNHFRRELGGISCGMILSESIAAGVQIDYFSERTSGEYENRNTVTFEAGMLVSLKENISIGIHVFNPVPGSLRKTFLPTSLRVGAGIELSKVLFAGAEAEMSSGEKLILHTGFEYEAFEKFRLRGGFSTENTSFSFGLGYLLKSLQLDLSFATHEKLGITSGVSLVFKVRE